jgi:hypothetical protein
MIAVSYGQRYEGKEGALVEQREFQTFAQFVAFVQEQQPQGTPKGPYICPPMLKNRRNKKNAQPATALTLDFDKLKAGQPALLQAALENARCLSCGWTTARSTPDAPRLRIVLALDRAVDAGEYRTLYRETVAWLAQLTKIELTGDEHCEELEQAAVLPQPSSTIWALTDGEPVHVDAVLQSAQVRAKANGHDASLDLGLVDEKRNVWLTSRAGHYWNLGLRGQVLLDALLADNQHYCRPPLPEHEVRTIARSAERNFKSPPTPDDLLHDVADSRAVDLLRPLIEGGAVLVASQHVSDATAARVLYRSLRDTLYRQQFMPVEIVRDVEERRTVIEPVTDRRLLTLVSARRRIVGLHLDKGRWSVSTTRLPKDQALSILNDKDNILAELRPIRVVLRLPLAIEHEGRLINLEPGYNDTCGVYVHGNDRVPEVALDEATKALLALQAGFLFASDADRSRAVAAMILPALVLGGFVAGAFAPVTLYEGDQSQAGKGLQSDVQSAIYGEKRAMVMQKFGGVGSLEESISNALLRGSPFVCLDNFRGTLNTPFLEALITSGDNKVGLRVPHRGEVEMLLDRVVFQITSNGLVLTPDQANRVLAVRLVRRPLEFKFAQYGEGSLKRHVVANRSYYYGCVLAVVRRWFDAGKPSNEVPHTFKEYLGALDWITQQVFALPPLLAGHEAIVERLASPAEQLMRQVALEVERVRRLRRWLKTTALIEMIQSAPEAIEPPGGWDREPVQHLGRIAGSYFRDADVRVLGHLTIKRVVRRETSRAGRFEVKRYCVWPSTEAEPLLPTDVDDDEQQEIKDA